VDSLGSELSETIVPSRTKCRTITERTPPTEVCHGQSSMSLVGNIRARLAGITLLALFAYAACCTWAMSFWCSRFSIGVTAGRGYLDICDAPIAVEPHVNTTWCPRIHGSFECKRVDINSNAMRVIWVPLWAPVGMCFLYCAWRWRCASASHERFECAHCGYDLTGNTSGICPECGIARVEGK
jgi:hypothetical protein